MASKPNMVALKPFPYGMRQLRPGHEFYAPSMDATALAALGLARAMSAPPARKPAVIVEGLDGGKLVTGEPVREMVAGITAAVQSGAALISATPPQSEARVQQSADPAAGDVGADLEALRAQFVALAGKQPDKRWSAATLRAKIKVAQDMGGQ